MAEGKKSFQLYTDLIDFVNGSNVHNVEVEAMTDEEVGKLFRWILEYVNDLHPVIPKEIKYVIAIVKRQLDEDLESWKKQVEVNRRNGALGGRPKKPKETQQNQIGFQETQQNPQKPDKDIDKDKDKDNINNNDVSISKDISTSTSEPRELALELPTIKGNYGTSYPVYKDQVDKWQSIYLGVNVIAELNKMYAWLEANPKNKKTYQGMPRFIVNWLSRQQDRASKNGVVTVPTYNDGTYKGFTFVDGIYYEGGFRAEIVPPDVRLHFEGGK